MELLQGKTGDIRIKEYLKEPPSREELNQVIGLLGIKPHELLRKGEPEYKDNYKGKDLTDSEWVDAMVAHPKLIERPIVIHNDKAVIGRPPENILEIV